MAAGKCIQEVINAADFCDDKFNSRVRNLLGLKRWDRGYEGGSSGGKESIGEGRILMFKVSI